jgi:cytoskeletal protein CcmA (bactofilin family)
MPRRTLTGDIKTTGDVTLGVNATVKSNIEAHNVTVAGSLDGHITARGEVNIRETGRVRGNVTSAGLAIGSGGIFVGASRLQQAAHLDLGDEEA